MQRGSGLGRTAAAVSGGAAATDGSREQQSESEYVMDSESDSDSSSSSSLASEEWGSLDADVSEAEAAGKQQHRARVQRKPTNRGNSAAAAAAAPAAAAAAAAAEEQGVGCPQKLHPPYSNLVWCEYTMQRGLFPVSRHLCTDIAGVSSSGADADVQVTVLLYGVSWDVQQHIRRQLQLGVPAGPQQGQGSRAADTTPTKQFGPYAATLRRHGSNLRIMHLQHQHELQTYWQYLAGKPHTLVLQERVNGSIPPQFMLHIKPGQPEQPKNMYAKVISHAGEAPGLQVAPGSVTEISNVAAQLQVGPSSQQRARLVIPRVLSVSQLPSDATYPMQDVTLTVVGQGEWQVNLTCHKRDQQLIVWLNRHHPLAALVARSISKMSLTQDKKLTITLAETPADTAAGAAAGPVPAPTQLPVQSATAGGGDGKTAAGAHTPDAALQATPAAAGQGLPAATAAGLAILISTLARPGTSPAAAAGGQPVSVLPLKRRASRTTEPRTDQQQLGTGSMAVLAVGAGAAAAAAGDTYVQPAAARKKVKQAAKQEPAAALGAEDAEAVAAAAVVGAPAAAPPTPAAATQAHPPTNSVPVKQEAPAGLSAQPGSLRHCTSAKPPAADGAANNAAQRGPETATAADAAAGTPGPSPAAAAGPLAPSVAPVSVKVEAPEVMDLTGDDNAAAGAAAAAQAAAAEAAPDPSNSKLPAGLRLASVFTLTALEDELLKLMSEGLMPLMPAQQYAHIMGQLRQLFHAAGGVSVDASVLQREYKYLQAAVMGGSVGAVVEELQALVKACKG